LQKRRDASFVGDQRAEISPYTASWALYTGKHIALRKIAEMEPGLILCP